MRNPGSGSLFKWNVRNDFVRELSAVRDIDLAWLEILARVILRSDPARICKPCLHGLSCAAEFCLLRKEPAKKMFTIRI